jgi:hypothetical protein
VITDKTFEREKNKGLYTGTGTVFDVKQLRSESEKNICGSESESYKKKSFRWHHWVPSTGIFKTKLNQDPCYQKQGGLI